MGEPSEKFTICATYLPEKTMSTDVDIFPGEELFLVVDCDGTEVFFHPSSEGSRPGLQYVGVISCALDSLTGNTRVMFSSTHIEGVMTHLGVPIDGRRIVPPGEFVFVAGNPHGKPFAAVDVRKPGTTVGRKDDGTKPDWSLLPWKGLEMVVRVMEFGASKYGRDNWLNLPDARRRLFSAAVRHLLSRLNGEKMDQESGLPHLAHAACCVLFMLHFEVEDTLDSR